MCGTCARSNPEALSDTDSDEIVCQPWSVPLGITDV